MSMVAEHFVVENHVKAAVLAKVDPRQFGTVPGISTTEAPVSKVDAWNRATDGNGAVVRVVLFDFRKAFDLIDHNILLKKLRTFDMCEAVTAWITDFLTCRTARQVGSGPLFRMGCGSSWSSSVPKSACSKIQSTVDTLASSTAADKFQFIESKCKELRINFSAKDTIL